MKRLPLRSQEFFEGLGGLARAAGSDDFYERLAELPARVVACDRWLVMRYARYAKPEFIVNKAMSREAVDFYLSGLYRLDPLLRLARTGRQSGVYALSLLRSDDGNNAYFDDIFRSALIFDELAILFAAPGQVCVAVCLDRANRRFTAEEIERVGTLFPALEGIHDSHIDRLFAPAMGGEGLFGREADYGIMVLDRDNRPVYANMAWRQFEKRYSQRLGEMVHRNRDRGVVSLDNAVVLHWDRLGSGFAMAPDGRLCVIERRAAEYVTQSFQDSLERFAGAHDLTPRERLIISLILRGYPNAFIARELDISYGTVRNYRHKLYNKLDITTERELFHLFLQLLIGEEEDGVPHGARAAP